MNVPSELRYTKTHEWVRVVGPSADDTSSPAGTVPASSPEQSRRARSPAAEVIVGITAHAQEELRDVVYVELPPVGKSVKQGEAVAVVESVKAAFDIYAPISGVIAKTNAAVASSPQLANKDCYGEGWFFAIQPSQAGELNSLMTADQYTKLIQGVRHP